MNKYNSFIGNYLDIKGAIGKEQIKYYELKEPAPNIHHKIFDVCTSNHFKAVTTGQGKEEDKIDKIYSSSLQSLLIFSKLEEKKKIKIKYNNREEIYTKMIFEYKLPVIKSPASMDVVLMNEDNTSIAFIESKLAEIPRDSNEGEIVAGVSYFSKIGIGYYNTLDLTKGELVDIGFKEDQIDNPKEGQAIYPVGENEYVYSYGIKQILAHLIGIARFKNKESAYSKTEEDLIIDHTTFKHIAFIELYNTFPHIEDAKVDKYEELGKEIRAKIEQFKTHCEVVKDIICTKGIVNDFKIMTYQELYQENIDALKDTKVAKFYHLDE